MIVAILSLVLLTIVGFGVEALWRAKKIKGETARKTVHITHGVIAATWPFFLNTYWILFLCLVILGSMLVTRRYKFIKSGYDVKRKSWGEFLFPVGIAVCALLHPNKWIFLAAILHLGLADGVAALFGTRYGKNNQFKVFGETRSIVGSAAFLGTSVLIIVFIGQYVPAFIFLPALLIVPITSTALEALAIKGTDNLIVPLFVTVALSIIR